MKKYINNSKNEFDHEEFYLYCTKKYGSEYTYYDECGDDEQNNFIRHLVDSIITIALDKYGTQDKEIIFFLADYLPDMEYGEIAQFMPDNLLDDYLLDEKKEWEDEEL